MSNATSHIDNKPSLRASHCEDEGRSKLKQSHPLIPALRFNEFDGYWNNQLLGNVVSKVGSGSTPSGGVQVYQKTGIPFIRSQNVTGNKLVLDNTHISESINLKMKGSIVKPHDILLNITGGSIGRSCVVPSDFDIGNVNQHVCIIRLKSDYTPRFLQPFLASHKGQKLLYQGMTGSGREGINFQSIRLFKLNLPSLAEQQKIATFLSAVDEKIQQLTKKKALLEDYKKGVMQQLFSGQLRFKDENGKDYPDWEEKRIGDLTNVNTGGTPRTMKQEYWGGNIRWMNSGELNLKVVFEVKNRITKEGLKNSATKLIPKKCILIGLAGQGKTRGTAAINMVELCTNQSIASILPNYDRFIPEYLFQNIDQRYSELRGLSTGDGGRGGLNLQIIKSFKVPLPSVKEQQKIANYLSGIDTKIEAVNTQITQTQTFKKGLLQGMFV
jgi:type I restriction enzyme S subunit